MAYILTVNPGILGDAGIDRGAVFISGVLMFTRATQQVYVLEADGVFVDAIERATQFTRPIHSITRLYGSDQVQPGAATLFFVNAEGWALTCRHVANLIIQGDRLDQRYQAFKQERAAISGKNRNQLIKILERKYGFDRNVPAEIKSRFVNCVVGQPQVSIYQHPTLDVALLKFSKFTTLGCSAFPIFAENGAGLKQGRSICRLGYPFPEFTNFSYDAATDRIDWTEQGRHRTPQFPIEGMVTRHLQNVSEALIGFELSTPGLRGQSGGPAFDIEGRVWGMQSSTAHLDLDFDIDMEVTRHGSKKRVTDSAFLHVGHCIHLNVLKEFMTEHKVSFVQG